MYIHFVFVLFYNLFYFSHTTKTTQWEDPRTQFKQQHALTTACKFSIKRSETMRN